MATLSQLQPLYTTTNHDQLRAGGSRIIESDVITLEFTMLLKRRVLVLVEGVARCCSGAFRCPFPRPCF